MKRNALIAFAIVASFVLGWELHWLAFFGPFVAANNLWLCPEGSEICDYNGKLVAAKPSPNSDCSKPELPCTTWAQVMRQLNGKIVDKPLTINYAAGVYTMDFSQKPTRAKAPISAIGNIADPSKVELRQQK